MKNKSIILSLLIACIFMHGCAVKSEATLLSEAKREYGDCEMVSSETSDKSVTIQLSDNEYGFKYDVSSSMDSIDIDGSCFGYLEGTHSNFSYKYMDNFSDLHKQEVYEIADEYKEYDLEFDDTFVDTTVLATIYCADEDKNIEAALRIGKIYHDYDTRGFWKKGLICCENYDPTTGAVSIGNVHIDDCKFYSKEDEDQIYYTDRAKQICKDSEFIGKETVEFGTLGVPLESVANTLGGNVPDSPDDLVTIYKFKSDTCGDFYIANFCDAETCTFYTNLRRDDKR